MKFDLQATKTAVTSYQSLVTNCSNLVLLVGVHGCIPIASLVSLQSSSSAANSCNATVGVILDCNPGFSPVLHATESSCSSGSAHSVYIFALNMRSNS